MGCPSSCVLFNLLHNVLLRALLNDTPEDWMLRLESELAQLNADLDEMTNEAKMSEDKAARAMVDAARLADELRCEQELAMNLEKDKKLLEAQCKDAATRADEAEVNALKGGRKAMIKMETRIRELESELDAETRRFGDVTKNLRKSERAIKELTFAGDEDRKNHERMQALIDQLQGKVTDENYAHI